MNKVLRYIGMFLVAVLCIAIVVATIIVMETAFGYGVYRMISEVRA